MTLNRVLFLGGNGHGAVRLERARIHLADRVDLVAPAYPGFEGGGPASRDFDELVERVAEDADRAAPDLVYATGIGGLVALMLRSRARMEAPLILQAPVLGGLESRWMPRLLRALPPARRALPRLFRLRSFRRWFVARYFSAPPDAATLERFFAAYDACPALPSFFVWLGPELLRGLEASIRREPARFGEIRLWWGGRDRVVPPSDWELTRQRLGLTWPLRVFPGWGHYPMLEQPAEWAEELARVAAA